MQIKKVFLIIFSLFFLFTGLMGIIGWPFGTGIIWYSWTKIIIGIIGLFVSFAKDK